MKRNWILIILSNISIVLAHGCTAPPNPIMGTYFINGATVDVGANINPYSILFYECDDMYTKTGNESIYCGPNGNWIGTMSCSKKCELPDMLTLDFTCSLGSSYINCDKIMNHGVIVKQQCKPLHKLHKNQILRPIICNNGHWSDIFRECATDCGREKSIVAPFILNGEEEERESSPWQVGIYQLKHKAHELICGGTIVSRKLVISAAHCFLQTPYEDYYAIGAGKVYRDWDHAENDEYPYIQRKMVEKVHIPNTYFGFENNLEDDIAVIVLKTPLDFYQQVHAACLDVNDPDIRTYISYNNGGKVVGWGVTKEGDSLSASNVLMKADIQIINRNECIDNIPREFIKFVTATKFCVKGDRNVTICNGDSGGGILVKIPDKGIPRWYLIGVVSVGVLNSLRTTCQSNTYTAITSVQSHADFLINELQSTSCSLLDGTSGVCKFLSDCKTVQDQISNGIHPTVCSSVGLQTFVCCPHVNPIKTTTVKPIVSPTENECEFPKDAITVNTTGQKAWDKCIDLADSVFPCVSLDPNSGLKMRMDTCKHTGVPLIIGGTATVPHEFPHQAQLGYQEDDSTNIEWNVCGGTLISEQWVMTTGHCLYNRIVGSYVKYIWLGNENLQKHPEFQFNIIERVMHPEYRNNFIYNDIGLLKMDKKVKYSEKVRPACLHVGNPVNDQKVIATGWGITNLELGTKSNALIKVILDKFTHEECSQKNPRNRKAPDGIKNSIQICYGSKTDTKDTCQGDAGGPIQIYNYGVHCTYTVIGITSVGQSCAVIGMPAIYTRVSAFVPWIESVVWP